MARATTFDAGGGPAVLAPERPRLQEREHERSTERHPPPPPRDGDGDGDGGDGGRFEGNGPADDGPRPDVYRFALALALGGIATLFAVFLAAWLFLGRNTPGERPHGILDQPIAIWSSTLALIASSLTLSRASGSAQRGMLTASLFLGVAFLVSQVFLWRSLVERGFVPSSGATMAAFYAVTGLHALHILGGLAAMARTLRRQAHGVDVRESIHLCATYWHFMGVVWVVIFTAFGLFES